MQRSKLESLETGLHLFLAGLAQTAAGPDTSAARSLTEAERGRERQREAEKEALGLVSERAGVMGLVEEAMPPEL